MYCCATKVHIKIMIGLSIQINLNRYETVFRGKRNCRENVPIDATPDAFKLVKILLTN